MALQPLFSKFDHTALKPGTTISQIVKLCQEALKYRFPAVCVNPIHVKTASSLLKGSGIEIATVVGFPLGATTTCTKVYETIDAINNGASEIDMVICIDAVKLGQWDHVRDDIERVTKACHARNSIVKVILEMCLLTEEEKKKACEICVEVGADYVKTSTGFSNSGASLEDVRLMSSIVKPHKVKVKAAGGIRTYRMALEMVIAGADRIGASSSVSIMESHFGDREQSFSWESGKIQTSAKETVWTTGEKKTVEKKTVEKKTVEKKTVEKKTVEKKVSRQPQTDEGEGPRIKFNLKKCGGLPSWSTDENQELVRLGDALQTLEKTGACPVFADGVAGNAAILVDGDCCGNCEGIMVSPSGKEPNKHLKPNHFVHVTDFDDDKWCASYKSNSDSRPTSDTPILWAALIKAWSRFGWTKRPRAVLHGHKIDSLENAKKLGVPCSETETTFSTPADTNALCTLFENYPYPEHRLYIRKGHGFFLMGDSVSDCMTYFNTYLRPFLATKNGTDKKNDPSNLKIPSIPSGAITEGSQDDLTSKNKTLLLGSLFERQKKQKELKRSFMVGILNPKSKL